MNRHKRRYWIMILLLILISGHTWAGQRRGASSASDEESPLDKMSVEELRTFQSYFYAPGGIRDPLLMREPTAMEMNPDEKVTQLITLEEQRQMLETALGTISKGIREQRYEDAIKAGEEILLKVENEWPKYKPIPEHADLIRMVEEIRSYSRMAVTLKRNQDIKMEFLSLHLKVDGVIWSPMDAKAVINGSTYSAGEVLMDERKQGDLRVEIIEERGVVFQFKGMRFHLPVDVYAPPNAKGDIG